MKKEYAIRLIILIAVAVITVGYGIYTFKDARGAELATQGEGEAQKPIEKLQLNDDIKKLIRANRFQENSNSTELVEKFRGHLYNYTDFKDELREEEIVLDFGNRPEYVTIEQAKEDIDYMFKMLKFGYGGYGFFGGDEAFGRAKQEILKVVEGNYKEISRYGLVEAIQASLSFIQDGHFQIEGANTFKRKAYINNNEYIIHKDEKGYYIHEGKLKNYVKAINGTEPDAYIKLSLDTEGNLIYNFGALSDKQTEDIDVALEAGNKKHSLRITLSSPTAGAFNRVIFNSYEKDGVPILENRAMEMKSKDQEGEFEELENSATSVKGKDVVILVIRGNLGGSDRHAEKWIKNFTGFDHNSYGLFARLNTISGLQSYINHVKYRYPFAVDEINFQEETKKTITNGNTKPGWTEVRYNEFKNVNCSSKVIVIIDRNVASAGETFVEYLHQLKNVVFIGTNTYGCSLVPNNRVWTLPKSKILLYCGKDFEMKPDLKNYDGIGYLPDFWVNTPDVVDRVVKFANKYDWTIFK